MLEKLIREAFLDESLYIEDISCSEEALNSLFLGKLEFIRVSLIGCRFESCDFSKASFAGCVFDKCVFTGCTFSDVFFKNCKFTACKGDECSFSDAAFKECIMEDCSFCYANFSKSVWSACTLRSSLFRFTFFTESKLKNSKLIDVTLSGADFFRTPLKGIDLSSCRIDGITVSASHSELAGAKISPEQAVDLVRILGVKLI